MEDDQCSFLSWITKRLNARREERSREASCSESQELYEGVWNADGNDNINDNSDHSPGPSVVGQS